MDCGFRGLKFTIDVKTFTGDEINLERFIYILYIYIYINVVLIVLNTVQREDRVK